MTPIVAEKLKLLPDNPGVYLMKNAQGKIIYVGKAVVLKNRVRQYFQSHRDQTPKVRAMVAHVADFETILTRTEVEALILECNLIKRHRPRYNISLKDDKSYPYVKVTTQEEFPRVFMTRHVLRDGARYFGPFTSSGAVHESLKLLRRLFPLRTCKQINQGRPCLEYHIQRCLAPCVGKANPEEYRKMVDAVCLFLEGRTEAVERDLKQRMETAAETCAFELAARLRDQLLAVKKVAERQSVLTGTGNQDAIGLARSDAGAAVEILLIREGKMVGREHFLLRGSQEESDAALLTAFLQQYYYQATSLPHEVLLPLKIEALTALTTYLAERKGVKVSFFVPQRGTKRDVVRMAEGNAVKYLADEATRRAASESQAMGAVVELQHALHLGKAPYRMECFDISHNQGAETVASMVVFEGGVAQKNAYRRFKIHSAEGKPDDFLSMREVTSRRYGKLNAQEMPDLIIIDGGQGQLSSALEIIRGAGHLQTPVIGLAKQFELVFVEGQAEPIELPRQSQALYLLQRIRDEAHRFAITYHRQLRGKRNLTSLLDHIEGIGPKRRQALWKHFHSLANIKAANLEELAKVEGMNAKVAQAVKNFFFAQEKHLSGED